jgi:protein SCO1
MTRGRARGASAMAVVLWLLAAGCNRPPEFFGEVVKPPRPAPELVAVNWDGKPFRLSELRGKVTVVFFGYTYCPDVCPFALAKMKKLSADLGPRADDVKVVFVSVDPQRDTVAKLAKYVPNFDRRFYGLRLEPAAVESLSESFAVSVQYGQPEQGPETDSFYYVDHTGTFFVIDREGQLRLTFPPNATAVQMRPDIEKLLAG